MTYDPVDANDDGVVESDVNNQSVNTDELSNADFFVSSNGASLADAFSSVSAQGGGTIVIVGDYSLSQEHIVSTSFKLRATGTVDMNGHDIHINGDNVTVSGGEYTQLGSDLTVPFRVGEGNPVDNITFDNVSINGNAGADTLITLKRATNVTIKNSTLRESNNQNLITVEDCEDLQIENNRFFDAGRSSIQIFGKSIGSSSNIRIEDNYFEGWMIVNSHPDAAVNVYGVDDESNRDKNIRVNDNTFYPTADHQNTAGAKAIRFKAAEDAVAEGNTIVMDSNDNNSCIQVGRRGATVSEDIRLINNSMEMPTGGETFLRLEYGPITIRGNDYQTLADDGTANFTNDRIVRLFDVPWLKAEGETIDYVPGNYVYEVSGESGFTMQSIEHDGLRIEDSNTSSVALHNPLNDISLVRVADSEIRMQGTYGIFVQDNYEYLTVANCYIEGGTPISNEGNAKVEEKIANNHRVTV